MKISIGIPAYNVEKYIEDCLSSTVKQDLPFSDYEVIVANDGSTDATYSRIVDFAKNYPNFIIIDKVNEGPGAARNACLDRASGEYIVFIDSDDTITENCLGSIYEQMKKENLDILEYDFICVDEERRQTPRLIYTQEENKRPFDVVMSGKEYLLFSHEFNAMIMLRSYRREFLLEHHLYIIDILHEDENFIPRAYYFAQRVKRSEMFIYEYMLRRNSIMGSYSRRNVFDAVESMRLLKEFVESNISRKEIELRNIIEKRICSVLSSTYTKSIKYELHTDKEMVTRMKKSNLYPFYYMRGKKLKIIYDHCPLLFRLCYNYKLRKEKN